MQSTFANIKGINLLKSFRIIRWKKKVALPTNAIVTLLFWWSATLTNFANLFDFNARSMKLSFHVRQHLRRLAPNSTISRKDNKIASRIFAVKQESDGINKGHERQRLQLV